MTRRARSLQRLHWGNLPVPPGPLHRSASYSAEAANALGYPEDSTLFYPVLLYQQGFRYFNMGYASAMAMLLLAVSFLVTFVIVRNSRRFVHYQAPGR